MFPKTYGWNNKETIRKPGRSLLSLNQNRTQHFWFQRTNFAVYKIRHILVLKIQDASNFFRNFIEVCWRYICACNDISRQQNNQISVPYKSRKFIIACCPWNIVTILIFLMLSLRLLLGVPSILITSCLFPGQLLFHPFLKRLSYGSLMDRYYSHPWNRLSWSHCRLL